MADRASTRGARGASRGQHHPRGGRGGSSGGGSGAAPPAASTERPKKENILALSKYVERALIVKFAGGREVHGTLKQYDQLMNLVMDDVVEMVVDEEGARTERRLGLLVARGTLLTSIAPADGSELIANPFAAGAEEEEGAVLG